MVLDFALCITHIVALPLINCYSRSTFCPVSPLHKVQLIKYSSIMWQQISNTRNRAAILFHSWPFSFLGSYVLSQHNIQTALRFLHLPLHEYCCLPKTLSAGFAIHISPLAAFYSHPVSRHFHACLLLRMPLPPGGHVP